MKFVWGILLLGPGIVAAQVFVPFVGCESYGQATFSPAPQGNSRSVPISAKDAARLAYYQSADGIGALGPRGWVCQTNSGSGGRMLFLSPKAVGRSQSVDGPAIDLYHVTNENSGRFDIAEVMVRLFPQYRAFWAVVLRRTDLPVPGGPWPKDILHYKGERAVEYVTPAEAEGLGTSFSWLKKGPVAIRGVAILIHAPPDMLILSMRLPAGLSGLGPAIIHEVQREARALVLK